MNDLVLPEELKKEVTTMEEMTRTVAVRTPEERVVVFGFIQAVKAKKRAIVDYFAEMKEAAFKAHRAISVAEKAETDKLDAFEAAGKRAIMNYDETENQKRLAEQRRLQAIADEQARREREKAQQEAARQAEIEKSARDKAEAARRAAMAASEAERAKLLSEAAAADRKAAAAAAKSENAANIAESVVAAVVEVAPVAEKQKGESVRKVWKWRLVDAALVPREYMVVNEAALNKMAGAMKGAIIIPGIQWYSEDSMSVRIK